MRYFYGLRVAVFLFSIMAACLTVSPVYSQVVAFPGAEGFGRFAEGGRGGRVIQVTNLNDSGPGSFRAALETFGPRIVVFRVGGIIHLMSDIDVENPFLTIAGQTAPGDGIVVRGYQIRFLADELIVRYLRVRPGGDAGGKDAVQIRGKNVIIDHCSFSWATDENVAFTSGANDVTIQWSIAAEGLLDGSRNFESKGIFLRDSATNISVHHNLMSMNYDRNPWDQGGSADFVNNVVYYTETNYSFIKPFIAAIHNWVGNFYKKAPGASGRKAQIRFFADEPGSFASQVFLDGNISHIRPNNSFPEADIINLDGTLLSFADVHVLTRHDFPLVTTTDAFTAYDEVVGEVGATLPVRDAVDTRIIADVRSGNMFQGTSGAIISDVSEVGGFPAYASGTPYLDTDADGMPDSWETQYGFNPNNAADGPLDADGDGWTNVEEFLNGTGPATGEIPLAPTNLKFKP